MLRDELVGMWKMISAEFHWADGSIADLYGPAPEGRIIYGPQGDMAVQIMRVDRPRFASGDFRAGSADEARAAVAGYMAYFGRYDVDETQRLVTHHIRGSVYPNWVGQDMTRAVTLEDGRLTLRTKPMAFGSQTAVGVLVWERLSAA